VERAVLVSLGHADAYIARKGMDLPPEPEAWQRYEDPDCLKEPILSLDLGRAGIGTILWATGFRYDFSWLDVDAFDEQGMPLHKRGVSAENGIYFLGLPDLTNRASAFIYGCWQDAKHIADHIVIQRNYDAYTRA
jgi:putative flavoprotein involved in K+ transport